MLTTYVVGIVLSADDLKRTFTNGHGGFQFYYSLPEEVKKDSYKNYHESLNPTLKDDVTERNKEYANKNMIALNDQNNEVSNKEEFENIIPSYSNNKHVNNNNGLQNRRNFFINPKNSRLRLKNTVDAVKPKNDNNQVASDKKETTFSAAAVMTRRMSMRGKLGVRKTTLPTTASVTSVTSTTTTTERPKPRNKSTLKPNKLRRYRKVNVASPLIMMPSTLSITTARKPNNTGTGTLNYNYKRSYNRFKNNRKSSTSSAIQTDKTNNKSVNVHNKRSSSQPMKLNKSLYVRKPSENYLKLHANKLKNT